MQPTPMQASQGAQSTPFRHLVPLLVLFGIGGSAITPAQDITAMQWSNAPQHARADRDSLVETVPPGTDFWRLTHYGFTHDNGPFRFLNRAGNFEAIVRVSGQYRELYHQAGLMVRIDEKNWIKAGIEFVNGHQNVSAVVTRDASDWSIVPRVDNPAFLWLRMQRFNDTVQVSFSLDGTSWSMIRLAYFPPNVPVQIGMVAAAPGKLPLNVRFDHFSVRDLTRPPRED